MTVRSTLQKRWSVKLLD